MIGDVSHAEHIYIVCGYTDMRKAIDGLVLSISLDTFYSNKNYAARKI